MRPHTKRALPILLVCLAAAPGAFAQRKPEVSSANHRVTRNVDEPQQKRVVTRPLTVAESMAILSAALDRHHHALPRRDCSHFIHELYERAGFPYEYASSADLYAGIEEFQRVESPQPGDLAVWHGHAGIVVSPLQHSFFSLLRSGPGVDSYDAVYWKRRGSPRFYRYVIAVPGEVRPTPTRTASLKPAVLGKPQPHQPDVADPEPDLPEEIPAAAGGSSTLIEEDLPAQPVTPQSLIVNSVRPKPEEVAAAFLERCHDWGQNLRGRDLFQPLRSLIVFDHFEVKKVHLAGSGGWVEVEINERGSFMESKAQVHKRVSHQRWALNRRDSKSWELGAAPNTIYLSQPVAVRVLARGLAQLTEDSPDPASKVQEKAEVARLLNGLLER
jgi:hypothetical protein